MEQQKHSFLSFLEISLITIIITSFCDTYDVVLGDQHMEVAGCCGCQPHYDIHIGARQPHAAAKGLLHFGTIEDGCISWEIARFVNPGSSSLGLKTTSYYRIRHRDDLQRGQRRLTSPQQRGSTCCIIFLHAITINYSCTLGNLHCLLK